MRNSKIMPWIMWFLAVLFFAYQFILRLSPGLMINDIMQKFDVDASNYGYFASMYYYGYALMQIPIAILLDRYGPRVIISICAFVFDNLTRSLPDSSKYGIKTSSLCLCKANTKFIFLSLSSRLVIY